MKEKIYTDEETQQAVLKELPKTFSRVSADVDLIEKIFLDNDIFNRDAKAEIFNRPDLNLVDYFDSEMNNLYHGITFLKSSSEEKKMIEQYKFLSIKLYKVFRPEKFIIYSIEYIIKLITIAEKNIKSSGSENSKLFNLSNLHGAVLGFNSYLNKVKGIEIDQNMIQTMKEINEELKKIPMPLIEF